MTPTTTTNPITRWTLVALSCLLALLLAAPTSADASSKNTRPTARADYYSLNEDTTLKASKRTGVLTNDSDRQSKTLVAKLKRAPYHGRVSLARDGSLIYSPKANYNGRDSFRYVACEAYGKRKLCSGAQTATIGVRAVNDAPRANDDGLQTAEDTAVSVANPGVLGNDTDPDGDRLKVFGAGAENGPSNGTLSINEDGGLVYKPRANFNGADTFSYKATDGSLTDTATVTVRVNAVNDAPVSRSDSYQTRKNTRKVVSSPGVLRNDYDPDGGPLTIAGHSQSTKGQVRMFASGGFWFSPNKDFTGRTYFKYWVRDSSGATDTQIVNIRVY